MSEQEQPGDVGGALWHLAEETEWQRALGTGSYDGSTRGAGLADVGFIHASRPEQLPGVVRALYAGTTGSLLVLEIDPAVLARHGVEVRVEPGDPDEPGSERFPHLYGPLPVEAVRRVRPARVERGWLELGPWEPVTAEPRR